MSYQQLADAVNALNISNENLSSQISDAMVETNQVKEIAQTAQEQSQTYASNALADAIRAETAANQADEVATAVATAVAENEVNGLKAELDSSTGAVIVSYKAPNYIKAVTLKLSDFLDTLLTVKVFGAVGDGIADDSVAIADMAAAVGYVNYPKGTFRVPSNMTIAVPQYFQPGAALTIDTIATLTITNRISSSNQHIFKGDGVVLINIAGALGEDAKTVQVGWFGVFPTNTAIVNQTPGIQRALNSFAAQTREGILQFECGSYHVFGTMYVPRGVQIAGRGMRRTVFDVTGADYTVWETAGNACKFTDFQFEYPSSAPIVRTAPYIHVKHNTCEILNIYLFPCTVGIIIDEQWCTIRNVRATYGLDPKSVGVEDTCMIWARSGGFNISDITQMNTTYSPHHVVRVGYTAAISSGDISDIQTTLSSSAVFIDGRQQAVTRLILCNLMCNPSAGSQFPGLIVVKTAGSVVVSYISMFGLLANQFADSLLLCEASDTSIISNITVGSAVLHGAGDYGVRLRNLGTGAVRDIAFGQDVDVTARTTRCEEVNTTRIQKPASMRGAQFSNPVIENFSLADDAVKVIYDNKAIFAGALLISSANTGIWGLFSVRSAGSANQITMMAGSANMATTTGSLSGTTGVDGKVTIGIGTTGQLLIENRIGANATISTTLLAGN